MGINRNLFFWAGILLLNITCNELDNSDNSYIQNAESQMYIRLCEEQFKVKTDSLLFLFILRPNNCGECNDSCIALIEDFFLNQNYFVIYDHFEMKVSNFLDSNCSKNPKAQLENNCFDMA